MIQAIPSFENADVGALGEPIGEGWSVGMAGASAMTTTVLDGTPVVLSGTRDGAVEIYDLDTGEQVTTPFTGHESAVSELHAAEVDGRTLVVSVEVGYAHVWELATGEAVGELDLGSDYDVTTVTEYQGAPAFVNAGKEIVVTALATLEPLARFSYDLGLAAGAGDVIDLDGSSILVAANVIGGEYGVGAWNLENGDVVHEYPMYEHAERGISEFAVGYRGSSVLALSGDFDGNLVAWDVAANEAYGPETNIDASTITGLTVAELDGTLVGVAATVDRTMAFWNVATGETLLETDTPVGFDFLAVSDLDGRPVLVAAGGGTIHRFWLG